MTIAPPAERLTTADLDSMLDDFIRCNSETQGHLHECTIEAVARSTASCTGKVRNWCNARLVRYHFTKYSSTCHWCKRLTIDCWRIFTI